MTRPNKNPAEDTKGPKPAAYKLKIDKLDLETGNPAPTGRELLALAGKTPPERYQLHQRTNGGRLEEVPLDGTVDLREPGVERFITLPLDQTEGEGVAPGGTLPCPRRTSWRSTPSFCAGRRSPRAASPGW